MKKILCSVSVWIVLALSARPWHSSNLPTVWEDSTGLRCLRLRALHQLRWMLGRRSIESLKSIRRVSRP